MFQAARDNEPSFNPEQVFVLEAAPMAAFLSGKTTSLIIVGTGAGGAAFILAVVAFFLCRRFCCRRRKNNGDTDHGTFGSMMADGQTSNEGGRHSGFRLVRTGNRAGDTKSKQPSFLHMPHQKPPMSEAVHQLNAEDDPMPLPYDADYPTEVRHHPSTSGPSSPASGGGDFRARTLSQGPYLPSCLTSVATCPSSPDVSPSSSPVALRRAHGNRFRNESLRRPVSGSYSDDLVGTAATSPVPRVGPFGVLAECALPQVAPLTGGENGERLSAQINQLQCDENALRLPDDLGQLHFSVSYKPTERLLVVGILSASRLPAGTKAPYVRVHAVNHKRKVHAQTTTPILSPLAGHSSESCPTSDAASPPAKLDPRNPQFNEVLRFSNVGEEQLTQGYLRFSVKDSRSSLRGRSKRIGEVLMPLNELGLIYACAELHLNVNLRAEAKFWVSTFEFTKTLLSAICSDHQ